MRHLFSIWFGVVAWASVQAATDIPFPDPGFENGPDGWMVAAADKGMSRIIPEAAHSGRLGLRVTDDDETSGSSLFSQKLPVTPGNDYKLTFHARIVQGAGIGVYLRFFDAKGNRIDTPKQFVKSIPESAGWATYSLVAIAPEQATRMAVWIHSFDHAKVVADFDDFSLIENPDTASSAAIRTAFARASQLHTLETDRIQNSRREAGPDFDLLLGRLDDRARLFIQNPLPHITSEGLHKGREGWTIAYRCVDLHAMVIAAVTPGSRFFQKNEAIVRVREGVDWILSHYGEPGTLRTPDPNVDRFVLPNFFDTVILAWPLLTEETHEKFARLYWRACAFQKETYGRELVFGRFAGYPNMDAAYLLILRQAAELFDDAQLRAESVERTRLLGQCFTGSTWDYLKGWPPAPHYTKITLHYLGRYWQLSDDPEALAQIKRHQEYYEKFLEPGGMMDCGMSPYAKHMWHTAPFSTSNAALELVFQATRSPLLRGRIRELRNYIEKSNRRVVDPLSFYWLSSARGLVEPIPTNFLRPAPETAGWQMRQTTPLGTWTVNLSGRHSSLDTRVSALTTPDRPDDGLSSDDIDAAPSSGLAGVFVELFQNGQSWFLGEMAPHIDQQASKDGRTVTITTRQTRMSAGQTARPMLFGRPVGKITGGTWSGGLPARLPVETVERWTLGLGRLDGEITVTTTEACHLDDVRLSLAPVLPRVDEKRLNGRTLSARYGSLCVGVTAMTGAWRPEAPAGTENQAPLHFRMDLPNASYNVTLVSGDADNETAPFRIDANGVDPGILVKARAGEFAERTFPVVVRDGSLRLRFKPSPSQHWKVNALIITRVADGAPVRLFDVGPANIQPAAGYERLSGSMVYNKDSGFGWMKNHANDERVRSTTAGTRDATLITSGDAGPVESPLLVLTEAPSEAGGHSARARPAGETWRAVIRVRQAASLDDFEKLP
ncbi:hypothetical protein OPIT5_12425 [Opitutaceae bacterium TAV5]|nr:hypothetical protein OPIT5_12425 [Opitutaceae bacterium TAV5]